MRNFFTTLIGKCYVGNITLFLCSWRNLMIVTFYLSIRIKGIKRRCKKNRSKYISYQITFKLEIRILKIGFRVISKKVREKESASK